MKKKIFAIVLIAFYVVSLPVYAYASIVQEAEMILKTAGRTKVAQTAAKMGTGFVLGRLLLGANVVTGAGMLGMALYDISNRMGDNSQALVTLPNAFAANNAVVGGAVENAWGKTGSYYCNEHWIVKQRYMSECGLWGTQIYYETQNPQPACTYPSSGNYYVIGQATSVYHEGVMGWTSCQGGSYVSVPTHRWSVRTYYYPKSSINPQSAVYSGQPGDDIASSAMLNTELFEQTKAEALQLLQEQRQAWEQRPPAAPPALPLPGCRYP